MCNIAGYAGNKAAAPILLEMLRRQQDFDDLEFAVGDNMRDLWKGNPTFVQHARLVYDVIYQLYEEGKLKRIVKPLDKGNGQFVNREFMWID